MYNVTIYKQTLLKDSPILSQLHILHPICLLFLVRICKLSKFQLYNTVLSTMCGWVLLNRVWLFATPWTVAHQAPLSTEFSRQQYCGGLPFPSPGDHPDPGIEPGSLTLQTDSLPSEPPGINTFKNTLKLPTWIKLFVYALPYQPLNIFKWLFYVINVNTNFSMKPFMYSRNLL